MILLIALMGCIFITEEEALDRYDFDDDGSDFRSDCDDRDPTVTLPMEWALDSDGDGWGAGSPVEACEAPEGYARSGDCDDDDASTWPEADELCDGVDNDCDGVVDEDISDDAMVWYPDGDGDGYGVDEGAVYSCDALSGYSQGAGDCDDADAAVNPAAEETCDGIDNDCDGATDDEDDEVVGGLEWAPDADGDGYGDEDAAPTIACEAPSGYEPAGDCDDTAADVNPTAEEICGDGVDNNCDSFACRYSGSQVADDVALMSISGSTLNGYLGVSVSGGHDLDEDGVADVLLGAPGEAYLESGEVSAVGDGRAYLLEGPFSSDISDPATYAAAIFETSEYISAELGAATAIGDLNGDDTLDVVVTGYHVTYEIEIPAGGAAFIFSGPVEGTYLAEDAETLVYGDSIQGMVGQATAAADLDGDGVDDLLVSAPYKMQSLQMFGDVYFFEGPLEGAVPTVAADVSLTAANVNDFLGTEIKAGQDVTGDGYPDALISAEGFDENRGAVYVLEGPLDATTTLSDAYRLTGEDGYSYSGSGLSFAGDVDGDGNGDVLVGAENYSAGYYSYEGAAYLILGPIDSNLYLGDADLVLLGDEGAGAGSGVAGLGDLDGDGLDDFAVGAGFATSSYGAAYLFYDTPSGDLLLSDADASFTGPVRDGYFGDDISSAGDADGDGVSDFWIAAPFSESRGAVYLFAGSMGL